MEDDLMMMILYFVIGFFVLGILVFVHEFGHFVMAKINKIGVDTFSIGFGKELWIHHRGDKIPDQHNVLRRILQNARRRKPETGKREREKICGLCITGLRMQGFWLFWADLCLITFLPYSS